MNKERIKSLTFLLLANIMVTWILIKTPAWRAVEWISRGVEWLILQSQEGINFVFGDLNQGFVFLLSALLPIVFVAAIIGLLVHLNVIPWFIKVLGVAFSKIFKVDPIVSVNAVCNMFLGQSESLFITKTALSKASDNVIFATLVGGMTSISVSVTGLYTSYGAKMEYVIISMVVTSLSSLFFCQLFAPTTTTNTIKIETDKGNNVIETMYKYAYDGFKSVGAIVVSLILFISMIKLINTIVPLTKIISYIFYPFAWLISGSSTETIKIAELLSTKLITNEAVAFSLPLFAELSIKTQAVMTVALCGFAGIGSIGILIGGYSVVAPDKIKVVSRLGFKALLVATIANIFSAWLLKIFL